MGLMVFLSFNDMAGKKDVFKVEDRELVIFQFFGSVKRYCVFQRTNKISNPGNGRRRHCAILEASSRGVT